MQKLSRSISHYARSTATSSHDANCDLEQNSGHKKFINLQEKEGAVKAAHINPQGRLKPYPLIKSDQDTPIPTYKTRYDFCEDIKKASEDSFVFDDGLFSFKHWKLDGNSVQLSQKYGFEYEIYDELLCTLWDSPTMRALINFASKHDWLLITDPLEEGAYDLDVEERVLSLNNYNLRLAVFEKPGYFRQALTLALIRGLRDIWHVECRQPYETGLSVESILFLERVRAADCDVIALLAAWELRCIDLPEVWRHLIGTAEGDMAMRFSNALEKTPSKNFDGGALIEAFHEWFENDARMAACDHQTLEMIDASLDDEDAKALYGNRRARPKFIESLSRLPDKSHYLRGHGHSLMNDPHFSGLGDDVNVAHFLQIQSELESTTVRGVAFRNAELAEKIFPEGVQA